MKLEEDRNIPLLWKEQLALYRWDIGRDIPWNPNMKVNEYVVQRNEITFDGAGRTMRLPPECVFVEMHHRRLGESQQYIRLPDAAWYYLSVDHLVTCSFLPYDLEDMEIIRGW